MTTIGAPVTWITVVARCKCGKPQSNFEVYVHPGSEAKVTFRCNDRGCRADNEVVIS